MTQLDWDSILKISGIITLVFFSITASSTLTKIKLAEFGEDNESKKKIAMKLVANVFIYLTLCLIVLLGIFQVFSKEVILVLFIAGLGALGIKLSSDLK